MTTTSALSVLPYYPALQLQLRSLCAALLVTYLEIHHPATQDQKAVLASQPVTVDMDTVAANLGVSRRTLFVAFCCLSTWWRSEAERSRASRAGREFIHATHTRHGTIKLFSIVGSKTYSNNHQIVVRRNTLQLRKLMQTANLVTFHADLPQVLHFQDLREREVPAQVSTLSLQAEKRTLADIMLRASVLDVDRRTVRYPRLREAVEAGLAQPEALKVKRRSR